MAPAATMLPAPILSLGNRIAPVPMKAPSSIRTLPPPSTCVALSQSESAQDCCIALPLFSTMTDHQQDHVIKSLAQVIKDESKDTYANTVS